VSWVFSNAADNGQGYDHVVLLLALIKLVFKFNVHVLAYRTILEWADHALFKMVRYVLLRPLRPELDGQDVEVRL
jgi:hypothetical protein